MEGEVKKSGENLLYFNLRRSFNGLTIKCKACPAVENMFRELSNDEALDLREYGTAWVPVGHPIQIYNFTQHNTTRPVSYTLSDIHGPPLQSVRPGLDLVNLSFLRMVGISEGDGITFTLKGVFELEELKRIYDGIIEAAPKFYNDMLKPVDMHIMVSTQVLPISHEQARMER